MSVLFRYRHAILIAVLCLTLSAVATASMWDSTAVRVFLPDEVQASGPCWAVVQDHRSLMYFGVNGGVLEFDGNSWRMIELPNGLACYALDIDRQGRVYVGSDREMGYLAPDQKGIIEYISLLDSLGSRLSSFEERIVRIASLPERTYFLGDKKLLVIENGLASTFHSDDYFYSAETLGDRFYVIDGKRGLLEHRKNDLLSVNGGSEIRTPLFIPMGDESILLFSQLQGFVRFTPGSDATERFTELPNAEHALFREYSPSTALRLRDGYLAVGTFRGGLAILDAQGRLQRHLTRRDGLPSDDIYSLTQDINGNLWLGTGGGIAVIVPSTQLGTFATDSTRTSVSDTSATPDSTVFRASIRKLESTINDSVLFGGAYFRRVHGMVEMQQTENLNLRFPHDYNAFRYSYSANFVEGNTDNEFQTYLEGLEKEWSSWSPRTFREYTNLDWGNYTFHVRAKNSSGMISEPATFSFQILPPWWETLWWYSAQVSFILLLLLVSGFLNKAGKAQKLSIFLITLVVIVVFEYLEVSIEPVIGRYSQGVAFFEVMIMVVMGLMLTPVQEWTTQLLALITGARKTMQQENGNRKHRL